MADSEKLHPAVFHTIGAILASLALPIGGTILYVGAVSGYYTCRSITRALAERRIGWGRHVGWSLTAGLVTMPVAMMAVSASRSGDVNPWVTILGLSVAATVLCFGGLVVLRFPSWLQARSQGRALRETQRRERAQESERRAAASRAQAESQKRQAELAVSQRSDGRRRLDARSKCEMAYTLHAPDIRERFPRAAFDQFLQTYMHDGVEAADVERRSVELQGIIEQHRLLSTGHAVKKPKSLEDITRWYIDERRRVQGMEVDDEIKSVQLGLLEQRYAELSERFLTTYEP
jgi:hypothetical protein